VSLRRTVGQSVVAVLHQHHEALGEGGELEPRAHHPTVLGGVETVVVVTVNLGQRGLVVLCLELDHPHPPEVGSDRLHVGHDARTQLAVRRDLLALVGPLVARLPEAAAVELTVGGGDGAKLVSPPLFQSMYSSPRYSCSGRLARHDPAVGE